MPSAEEVLGTQDELQSIIDSGLNAVSGERTVKFRRYEKYVLSSDGFVFWVATPSVQEVGGTLHYATDRLQDEDQTIGANHVLLNSGTEIAFFNEISPSSLWLGSWPISDHAPPLRVAFSQHTNYFRGADTWHYAGFSVYPALDSQILDDPAKIPAGPIVSNSLPIFLAQNSFCPVYPAFLVPDNVKPPYIAVHIEKTEAIGPFPVLNWPGIVVPNSGASPLFDLASSQLMRDYVRLTLYGFDSETAIAYLISLIEGTKNETIPFGFANTPAIEDAIRTQVEIAARAQKKQIEIDANYYQNAANVVAYRLLLEATLASITLIGGFAIEGEGATIQDEQTVSAEGIVWEA